MEISENSNPNENGRNRVNPAAPISPYINRQALHAAELSFAHPMTTEWQTFAAPLPDDMERAIQAVGTLSSGMFIRPTSCCRQFEIWSSFKKIRRIGIFSADIASNFHTQFSDSQCSLDVRI